ncbi:SIR2 family protein [Nocardioides pelophilus]|uniref:SIR2 family protein n=1 Tax=Nocardioides pelophilus TaxID=2172019 RepID=UPI0015FEBEB9|nr:SIR2 family protein [Nocardioides pelophilus]
MNLEDRGNFIRAWAIKPQRFAWLLGAGASALAGLPTASQIRDDLLLRLYADRHGLVRQHLHPNDPAIQAALDAYFNGHNGMVPFGTDDDYSTAFELALPEESSRHEYLQGLLSGRKPSYGQRIFGALISAGLVNITVTTNFDALIEQAAAESFATVGDANKPTLLNVAALGSSDRARQILKPSAHPTLIKLHGDFQESALKNLKSELASQDAVLRQSVHDASRSIGLAVVGYSGRDDSVMEMLESASKVDGAWPAGLWWFTRNRDRTSNRVISLLQDAQDLGVSAHLLELETFDELMVDLAKQADLTAEARKYVSGLQPRAQRTAAAPPTATGKHYPIIRYNAIPILSAPATALRATISGVDHEEFRARCRETDWRGVAVMAGGAVWGWGNGEEFSDLVGSRAEVVDLDLTSGVLEPGPHALLVDGLTRAIAKALPAWPRITRRHNEVVLEEWDDLTPERTELLQMFKNVYGGHVAGRLIDRYGPDRDGQPRRWAEAVRLHVEFRWGLTWLIFSPYTWVDRWERSDEQQDEPDSASEWRRERWVQRKKNEKWAELIQAWTTAIAPGRKAASLRLPYAADPKTFGGFRVGATSAYSWRAP